MEMLPGSETMKARNGSQKSFVICVDNSDYPASLQLHKVYEVLRDERAAEDHYLRVVDESGEDYLYSATRFVAVDLPARASRSVVRRVPAKPTSSRTRLKPKARQRKIS